MYGDSLMKLWPHHQLVPCCMHAAKSSAQHHKKKEAAWTDPLFSKSHSTNGCVSETFTWMQIGSWEDLNFVLELGERIHSSGITAYNIDSFFC